ncbi:hypothetical protein [Leifsonia xyli]|uniref:hypothetical protein n=1 Tax=Leifsonia xyli TaxID=1575 RepID=UPI003D668329
MTALSPRAIVGARSIPAERTPQRLDPLGVQSAWLLVPLLGGLALVYAVFSTFVHRSQLRDPDLAVVAIGVLLLTVIVASLRTHPGFAPFGRWSHFSIIGVALTAACLFDASVWGRNERIQDDWGQIAVALLLVAMPLYRPIGEVAGSAVVSALVLGSLAAAQHSLVIANVPLVYATVAATPVLALAAGGAGYAWTMTGETLRWRELARQGQARLEGELRQAAERMVAQERMTALNAEAVPFLTGIAQRGVVTAEDAEIARAIADRLRALSVRAVGRTWLDDTLHLALGPRTAQAAPPGADRGSASSGWTTPITWRAFSPPTSGPSSAPSSRRSPRVPPSTRAPSASRPATPSGRPSCCAPASTNRARCCAGSCCRSSAPSTPSPSARP